MTFEELATPGVCSVCGRARPVVVCCSAMGPVSYAYCKKCHANRAEPYGAMVAYISAAGRFPEDINETYQELVRNCLHYLGKTEEQFSADVEQAIQDEIEYFKRMEEGERDALGYF